MDYSKLSDFEINILVAKAGGHGPLDKEQGWAGSQKEPFTAVIVKAAHILGAFDPCNNPADAWPVIVGNRISLGPFDDFKEDGDYIAAKYKPTRDNSKPAEVEFFCCDKPLRAAMIVFLMMQEGE